MAPNPSTALYAVVRERGPAWDASRPMREQALWPEHADFMDGLVSDGFVVLGGPLGEGERTFLLAVRAEDAEVVRARLAADPWSEREILAIAGIEPWTILLGRDGPRLGARC